MGIPRRCICGGGGGRRRRTGRCGFNPNVSPVDRARNRSLFFDDLLDAKVRKFNPCYSDAIGFFLRDNLEHGAAEHFQLETNGGRVFQPAILAVKWRIGELAILAAKWLTGELTILSAKWRVRKPAPLEVKSSCPEPHLNASFSHIFLGFLYRVFTEVKD